MKSSGMHTSQVCHTKPTSAGSLLLRSYHHFKETRFFISFESRTNAYAIAFLWSFSNRSYQYTSSGLSREDFQQWNLKELALLEYYEYILLLV